jgi:hypothetical protein
MHTTTDVNIAEGLRFKAGSFTYKVIKIETKIDLTKKGAVTREIVTFQDEKYDSISSSEIDKMQACFRTKIWTIL